MSQPTYNVREGQGRITFEVDPITLRTYLKAIGGLTKELQDEIRNESQIMSRDLANDLVRSAASSPTPVARRVANSISTPRDRLPTVKIGGKKKVGIGYRSRFTGKTVVAAAGELLYGSEYGASGKPVDRAGRKMTNRFKAPHNDKGYWINPTTEQWGTYLFNQWFDMVERILDREGINGR